MTVIRFYSGVFLCLILTIMSGCSTQQSKKLKRDKSVELDANHFVFPPLPASVKFCGEVIKLRNFDITERLDKEIIVNAYYHSSTIQSIKRANRYFGEIEKILKEQNVPDDFKYLCVIESGLMQVTSPVGAKGFWQFMPETAKDYGLKVNNEIDERMHIEKSTIAACQYLKEANSKFNDWVLTAAAYNRGVAGIENDLEEQEVSSYFDLYLNGETNRYVFRILALKLIFENQKSYGFDSADIELYQPIKTRTVEVKESVTNLKKWAKEQGSNYRMLKLLNPWIISNKLTVKDTTLHIELPQ